MTMATMAVARMPGGDKDEAMQQPAPLGLRAQDLGFREQQLP